MKYSQDRNEALIEFAGQLEIPNPQALNDHLPHYRYFEFRNEKIKIVIRPDAGIEHGWFLSGSGSRIYNERTNANSIFKINKKDNNKLLYTISVEKTK